MTRLLVTLALLLVTLLLSLNLSAAAAMPPVEYKCERHRAIWCELRAEWGEL